ncbi:hypothetical protein AFCA_011186 [Aspergillus flavus]|uniref:C2H2-type domain-containing protein n=1 Tax=Aspergillus flavus TaxID=5059 RepID=A0AB74CNW4_ASPFL|nr:hypothetical protein CA14_008563 [Aspergillus flavus]UDD63935.1 hypothetical protein AFCA_011186 [Aspergillus flavus]
MDHPKPNVPREEERSQQVPGPMQETHTEPIQPEVKYIYTCLYPGCQQRFDTVESRDKHKHDTFDFDTFLISDAQTELFRPDPIFRADPVTSPDFGDNFDFEAILSAPSPISPSQKGNV